MVKTMDYLVLQEETFKITNSFNLSQLTLQQLVEIILLHDETLDASRAKEELIIRGRDEMNVRISIKKYCKQLILESEADLKEYTPDDLQPAKENLKTSKKKFLILLSLLDRLQLEWQRYDLTLMH